MNQFKKLSMGKQVLFVFGTLCAILVASDRLLFFGLRSIEDSSRQQLSYVVNETPLTAPQRI
jgi:hypothetical protein